MTLLEKAIGLLRPRPRVIRETRLVTRIHTAAEENRLTSDWTLEPLSADEIVFRDQRKLRARSRERCLNDGYVKKYIRMAKTNIVGAHGIRIQSRLRDGDKPSALNEKIEAAWKTWGRKENCDAQGRLSWYLMQRLFIETVPRDGEFLAQIKRGAGAGPFGYQLLLLDPELLDISLNRSQIRGGGYIRMGIEYDEKHRAIAYHLIDPARAISFGTPYSRKHIRVPAGEIIHSFLPEMVGQSRGLPWTAVSLARMKQLSAFEDAAVVNARIGASKAPAIEQMEPGSGGYQGEAKDSEGNAIQEIEPGSPWRVPYGYKMSQWSPEYPKGEFGPFMKTCLRGISAGWGIAYNAFANDLEGVTYGSLRQGAIDERDEWRTSQSWMIEAFCLVVFAGWVRAAVTAGALDIDPMLVDQVIERAAGQARGFAWIDPLKDQQANNMALDNRLTSYSQLMREQGLEPEEVWAELASDLKRMKELGIAPNKQKPAKPAEKDEEDAEDKEDEGDAADKDA